MKKLRALFYYDPAEGTRLCLVLHWLLNIAFLALWTLGVGIASLYFAKVNYGPELFQSYFQYTGLFLLNIIPGFIIALLFLIITNRVWPAVLASGILVIVPALINYFKLMFRNDPLLFSDISYITEAANMSGTYNVTLTPAICLCFAAIAAATVLAAFFMKARFRRAVPRIVCAVLLVGASVALYFGAYISDSVYAFTSNLGVEFENGYVMNQWNETDKYCCRGFMYPLINSAKDLRSSKPDGYNRREAEAALASYESGDIAEDKKVSVISVMMEAYSDLSVYDSLPELTTDPYEFFHQLQAESVSGSLVTNIFAGGTIDTERCYITGSTQMYEYRAAADSYARYFNSQGYFTEFCHPGYGWFYNRQNVMEYLGFQSVNFFEGRYQQPEGCGIMRDDSFFPDLSKLFQESVARGEKYFNFSVTYQNHGPYATDYLYDTEREYVSRGGLSEESYNILNNYFWGIKLTDDSLRSFINSFRDSSEPVVIVLFGDHKPWLGDGSTVYSELGIDLSRSTDDSFYNYYETPYVIWANDAAKQTLGNDFTGDGGSFSPAYLMMKLFDLCSYEGDGYMGALREMYASGLDVINSSGRYRENGVLTTALSGSAQEILDKFLCLEYYRVRDAAE